MIRKIGSRITLDIGVLFGCLAMALAVEFSARAAEAPLSVPVSVNALMVTMIDHSAHHLWDHQALERDLTDEEWRLVEYFAIQLAGSGPLIALGGTGPNDRGWAMSPQWSELSQAMSSAALVAMDAAKVHDRELLANAGEDLLVSCESCHDIFKPESPTEGFVHQPDYDHLYHMFGQ